MYLNFLVYMYAGTPSVYLGQVGTSKVIGPCSRSWEQKVCLCDSWAVWLSLKGNVLLGYKIGKAEVVKSINAEVVEILFSRSSMRLLSTLFSFFLLERSDA